MSPKKLRIGSLFSGYGGLDLAATAYFDAEVVWHVEYDKYPSMILDHHYPGIPNFGDVKSVDWKEVAEVAPIDILTGGYPCFPAGAPVLTARGYLPIEDVRIGDQVLTHMNRWRRVTATMSREHEIVEFAPGMYATPDHPFWTREPVKYWNNEDRQYRRRLAEPVFTPAAELRGKFVATPMNIPALPIPELPDRLTWWQIGRWLADGFAAKNNVFIDVGPLKVERDTPMLDGFTSSSGRTVVRFRMQNAGTTASWLKEHFGHLAHAKKIPAWALGMPEEDRRELLAGYLSGDGYVGKHGVHRAVTVSRFLMVGIRALATTLGYTTSVEYHRTTPTTIIEGRTVNQRNWWRINIATDDGRYTEIHGDHRWSKIRKPVKPAGRATVYDITVEEDHSFICYTHIVSNCQPFSHAGRRKGKEDERHLWPYVADALRVLRPRIAFFENVAGHLSLGFDAVASDLSEMGLEYRWGSVRASDAGAPHRRERLFIVAFAGHGAGDGSGKFWGEDVLDAGHGAGGPEYGVEPAVASFGAGESGGAAGFAADRGWVRR